MIDVFIRTSTLSGDGFIFAVRESMCDLCLLVWQADQTASSVSTMVPFSSRKVHFSEFGIASKKEAEKRSKSEIYVVADEDCLPIGNYFIARGVDILTRHPEYGLLSATSLCDGHFPAGIPTPPEEVVEMQAGGIAFVRKGILSEFRDCRPDEVDDVICSEMNRKGYKTGVMPSVRFNHLGCGYSIYQRFATPPSKQSV